MHGAIVADALRVPWIPVKLYGQIVDFKWHDWAESLGMRLSLRPIAPVFQEALFSRRGLDHAFKRSLCALGWGKEKWERYSFLPSNRRHTESVIQAISKLAVETTPLLSTDSAIDRAETRLMETLDQVRAEWRGDTFRSDFTSRRCSASC
jgi:succinoglycan biosynthesis protein ExoV